MGQPAARRTFVISDLHLGGEPAFQMCPQRGQEMLERFVDWAAAQHSPERQVRLVLNGDIADFLAEAPFDSFTNDHAGAATAKVKTILCRTRPVWDALGRLVSRGAELTLMLGNHDIELSLPGPRAVLLKTLGPGRVTFLYDNQAFVEDGVLIEHGNRYDGWNVVAHDFLRQIRSRLSRREKPGAYDGPPGSQLVQEVMNPIKKDYSWVDLLKPETSGVLPILAVLEPKLIGKVVELAKLGVKAKDAKFDRNGIPQDPRDIAGYGVKGTAMDPGLKLALELAGRGDRRNIAAVTGADGLWARWQKAIDAKTKKIVLQKLLQALRYYAKEHRQAFEITREAEEYSRPARSLLDGDFKVVIFGHTHLAKRVALGKGLYLNTGTWADLMCIPAAVLDGDEEPALKALAAFVEDLRRNRIDHWRGQVPTFAQVDYEGDGLATAGLYEFTGDGQRELREGQVKAMQ